jgi:methylmalonyl-CoA/ethylmalonyl-CoA epimerase
MLWISTMDSDSLRSGVHIHPLGEVFMISRVDHVSLAVKDFDAATGFFVDLLGAVPGAAAEDPGMKYRWQLLSLGDLSRIELITPTGPGSYLDNFLKDRQGGVHHITLQTPDIRKAKEALEERNIPTFGSADYGEVWKELFIHPRHAFGVLMQLAEFTPDDWLSPSVRMTGKPKARIDRTLDGVALKIAHPGGGTVSLAMDRDEATRLLKDLQEALE